METKNRQAKNHLARDLEQAIAKTAILQQQRADMVKAVARSPQKQKPKTKVAPKPKQADAPIAIPAYRPVQLTASMPVTGKASQQQRERMKPSHKPRLDAIKENLNTNVVKNPTFRQQQKQSISAQSTSTTTATTAQIVPIKPTIDRVNIQLSSSPLSPKFLTSKTRNMHCELDDPGIKVPYPRNHPPRHGFFKRLLSCFAPPPASSVSVFPGHGPSHSVIATPPARIVSTKVTPPVLQLRSEMEPLRQSLASLKPGLLSDALADTKEEPTVDTPGAAGLNIDVDIILQRDDKEDEVNRRRAIARSVAAEVAANPPTPRFGGMPALYDKASRGSMIVSNVDSAHDGYGQGDKEHGSCVIEPEVSFESTTAEPSDAELTPEIASKKQPLRSKRMQSQHPAPASQRESTAVKRPKHNDYYSKHVAAVGKKPAAAARSNFTVQDNAMNDQQYHANKEHAKALESALLKAIANKPVPLPPNTAKGVPLQQHGGIKKTGVSVAGLVDTRQGARSTSYAAQHATHAVAGQPFSAPASPRQQQKHKKHSTAAAVKNSNAPTIATNPSLATTYIQQRGVKSAPVSRVASPLKAPSIRPRMNRAAAARSNATQRLLDNRRQREAQQWAALPEAVKLAASRKQQRDDVEPQQQLDDSGADEGFHLPPAGSGKLDGIDTKDVSQKQRKAMLVAQSIKHIDVSNVPFGLERGVASIDYKQMLEQLALGKSYDENVAKVVTKPSAVDIPLQERAPSSCNSTTNAVLPSKNLLLDRIVNVESSLTIQDLDALKAALK